MNYRSGIIVGILGTLLLVGCPAAVILLTTSSPPPAPTKKPEPASTVAKILKEDELNTVVLAAAATKRLAIETAPIERRWMPRVRTFAGETVIPPGQAVIASAPLGGILRAPVDGLPVPGSIVRKGHTILLLLPLLTPEARTTIASARVDAENQIKNAATQVEAARIALDRAKRLLTQEAGSQRNVDETQALHELATKALDAANDRRNLLARIAGEVERGTAEPIAMEAPQQGILRSLAALPGQSVPAGAALFEVADLRRVWIKTALYAGDIANIAPDRTAQVARLGNRPGAKEFPAKGVSAPPSANPLAATVDRYYEVDNVAAQLSPGERVAVTIPMAAGQESLALPWSAVIHDIYGSTWVYVAKGANTFVRHRVQVSHVDGSIAGLVSGPPAGSLVVAHGAAELFGAEVGFSK